MIPCKRQFLTNILFFFKEKLLLSYPLFSYVNVRKTNIIASDKPIWTILPSFKANCCGNFIYTYKKDVRNLYEEMYNELKA